MHTSDNEHHNTFFRKPLPRTPHHVNIDVVSDQWLYKFLHYETKDQYITCAKQNHALHRIIRGDSHFILGSLVVAKLTTATELAAAAEKAKPPVDLPKEFQDFTEVFTKEATDHIPPPQPYDHEINLDETFIPKIGKIYPLSPEEKKATEDFLEENFASGKICPSNSLQASPFFFIKKKDRKLCPCQDYHYLNEHTICDVYPLPLISDLVDKLKDAKHFTKFDVQWGYNNVRIKDGHQWKVAFITHKGLFEPTVMFFSLNNFPTTFQRFMNDSFRDMITEGWLIIYMDDLLIFIPDKATYIQRTRQVLQWMTELDLHLKLEKCQFTSTEMEYLGMIVRPRQLAMDPVKLDGIASWPTLTKVKEVCSFLGFANFYHYFILDYSTIAHPLLDLTKKDHCWDWTPEVQTSFDNLKQLFLLKPIFQLPDFSKPFTIATDASRDASSAILLQIDSNSNWHPCSYLSQTFFPAKQNYDIYDRELLAIIHTLKSWQHYLHGSPFPVQVFTDHKNLTYFCKAQKLNRQQARWLLDLTDFDLKIVHVPGKLLASPDTLSCRSDLHSRKSDNTETILLPDSLFVNLIDSVLHSCISSASTTNPLILQHLQSSLEPSIPTAFHSCLSDWQISEGILTYKGPVYIPPDEPLQRSVMQWCHDHETTGHPGYLKTHQLVAAEFWWPGLAQYIHKYVEGCTVCQQNKFNTHPTTPPLTPVNSLVSHPFQQISCDLITNLPPSSGFDSLLVVVDHGLTKGVILCPTKKTVTAEGIATLFFYKVYLRFGLYNKIIFDRGPQFASAFAKELGCLLNYNLSLSTAYHPQTDGETKHVNQEIKTYLWIFCRSNPTSWADKIPHIEFTHNHCPHSVTNQSPFYLMMGYEPHALPIVIPETSIPAMEDCLKTLNTAHDKALASHELTCQVMSSRNCRGFKPFEKGDKVWLEAKNLKCSVTNPKFAPKREGPFAITKVLSPITYQLRLPKIWKIHPVFHASLLSSYHKNNIHGPNFPAPPPDLIKGEEEYEIEKILCHCGSLSSRMFLI